MVMLSAEGVDWAKARFTNEPRKQNRIRCKQCAEAKRKQDFMLKCFDVRFSQGKDGTQLVLLEGCGTKQFSAEQENKISKSIAQYRRYMLFQSSQNK